MKDEELSVYCSLNSNLVTLGSSIGVWISTDLVTAVGVDMD
jgi:hypothetical protein